MVQDGINYLLVVHRFKKVENHWFSVYASRSPREIYFFYNSMFYCELLCLPPFLGCTRSVILFQFFWSSSIYFKLVINTNCIQ